MDARAKRLQYVFILLLLASAGFTFLRSPYFRVEHIDVRGLRGLSTEEVVVACGLAENENIFDVDLQRIASRVKAIPRVDKVLISRHLPSTIVIKIEERTPVAVLPYAGYFVEVDGCGMVIGLDESYRAKELPLLTGITLRSVKVGYPVDAPEIAAALAIATTLPASILQQVSEINFDSAHGFSLHMQSGTQAILGSGGAVELESRAKVLEALLARLEQEGRHATYIDVRFEKRPVVKTWR
ncbi:MAG: FtsQ-type POTRA domain-containing protein [Bacillota bacterium]|nr:FtsQ-type POTRA domain-containing protein [Bacillota bacterium]